MFGRSINKMKKWFILKRFASVVLLTSALLASCQPAAPATQEPTVEKSPITIGVSLPLTGQRSESGAAAKAGYEVWVSMVNESGGLLGQQIDLQVLDNASDDKTVAADYEKLINTDKVDLVVGTQSSFLVIPSSEVASKYGYAYVEPAGGSPQVFSRGLTDLFFVQPAVSARQADPFALYILSLPANQRPKTFAVVTSDDTFVVGIMDRLKGLLTDGGLQQVYEKTYPADATTGFDEIAAEVAAVDPDLIIGGTQFSDSIAQIKAYQASGYQPRTAFFTSGPSIPQAFRDALGEKTEGIFSSVSWFPESKEYQNADFAAGYIKLFGGSIGDIPEDAANAFTVGQVLQQAVEKIQSIDNAALIKELHQGTYKTIVGQLSFDETGAPKGSYMLLQWQGDKFLIVGPQDRAEVDPLPLPKPAW
jgi:branched-chain amino acid transport system substrate-binding protein